MIQYIIEVLAFQLLFLVVYDLFLKKETFFNWNRVYLVGTSLISLVIPVIEFSAISTAIPEQYTYVFPVFEPLNEVILTNDAQGFNYQFQWMHIVYLGMLLSFVILLLKLFKIHKLVRRGKTTRLENYTKVLLTKSKQAFSFFRFIFLGDAITTTEASQIIEHELVHVKQKHSIDLLYFEILRVVFWFNPLVYVYQNRMAALHEFIADAHAVKANKKAYVNELLSQAFQTQHISFVNQFLKPSLLTKRLKMISREQSRTIFKLKYLFLLPLVGGMLIYNSCEKLDDGNSVIALNGDDELIARLEAEILPYKDDLEKVLEYRRVPFKVDPLDKDLRAILTKEEHYKREITKDIISNSVIENLKDNNGKKERKAIRYKPYSKYLEEANSPSGILNRQLTRPINKMTPFAVVDEVPIFPGCENAADKRACFQEKIQEHIRKNFRYPAEAQAANIQGRVYTNFVIGTDGVIRNLRMRGPDKLLELEVSRMINILPKMIPGKHQGQSINVLFSIPVTFKLNDGSTSSTDKTSLSNNQLANLERMNVKEAIGLLQEKVIPFAVIEESPLFPGCENADDQKACFSQKMQEHIMKYFEYSEKLQQEAVEGKVYVNFYISTKGEIENLRLRGPDERLEEAVKKIIHKLPQFGPGRHKGKSVPVSFSIPITYKLH
ncbi:M56 family metallopeptidase [Spongiivirga sp. MCCC 1A20706]|uniref:TonB family protein n=1 Tax=Spongiivirga sp. MCCC 1A20706 TaxID=3160963 RepID=UPI0039778825